MFDIGFLEIFVILVVAILALGPDKLPEFISSVAKTIKGVKRAIGDAKASVENEINLEDMKKEVDSYKNSIDFTKETIEKNNPANIAQKEISNIQEQLSNTYQDDQVIPDDLKNKEKDEEDLVKNKKEKKKKEKKEKKKKKKKRKKKMFENLKPHIKELRYRLTIIVASVFIGFFSFFTIWDIILNFMTIPLKDILPTGSKIIFTKLQEPFFTAIKVSFFSSFLVTLPIILWQIWAFIAPGLYEHEKKMVLPFVFFATFMFLLGSCFSYYVVVPIGFKFLVNFGSTLFTALPSIGEYVTFFTKMVLGFGLAFQLPVATFFLAKIGIVTDESLRRFFRYAVIIIFVLSAILTPPDLITQFLMAVPMVLLYIMSIYIAKYINPANTEDEEIDKIEDK